MPAESTLAAVGEFGLIAAITRRLPQGDLVELGPGHDAAVLRTPDSRVVVSTDVLVESIHFRRDWSSAADVGAKAAAQNLADIAALGARGTGLVVGLAAPPDLPTNWVLELADGLRGECDLVGASIVGGDVVRSPGPIMVSVTALGDLEGRAPVTRAGARAGDTVAVTGRLGWAAGGLGVLRRGFRSPRVLVEAHRRPRPPYDAGPQAARAGARAMCDVSDGLVADLAHIAEASGVQMRLETSCFDVPDPLRDAAAAIGTDPLDWVLRGGEDHALVACFPPGALPEGWRRVGEVGDLPSQSGEQTGRPGADWVLLDGSPVTGGHDHFG